MIKKEFHNIYNKKTSDQMNELPTTWDLNVKSTLLSIDGLKVKYIGPDDKVAVRILANNPIPSQCKLLYFEVKIIDRGKNGTINLRLLVLY
ncbi:hypothetical protein C2G38_1637972 [Gigaspora rosea]|uniref:Uncharacterized protein n=1 Tax=Gigaspora rosea TaxID=44941 RepID=A0A397V5T8_9GLOM|nr:hypothetical protein C2G38_1637972 [Gigaspora rosea]